METPSMYWKASSTINSSAHVSPSISVPFPLFPPLNDCGQQLDTNSCRDEYMSSGVDKLTHAMSLMLCLMSSAKYFHPFLVPGNNNGKGQSNNKRHKFPRRNGLGSNGLVGVIYIGPIPVLSPGRPVKERHQLVTLTVRDSFCYCEYFVELYLFIFYPGPLLSLLVTAK